MTESVRFTPKKDRYAKARGGNSQFLDIFCVCGAHIVLYQKDGPGALLRMYLDRIFAPESLSSLNSDQATKDSLPAIRCPECGTIIAVPMIYEPEHRLAFRMIPGTYRKKKSDGTFPPAAS